MRAAASIAAAEGLPDIPPERVYVRLSPDRAKVTYPCVIVTLEGCKEAWLPLDTENDVLLQKWLGWRQNLRHAYLMQLMADVPEVWHVDVEPVDTVESQRLVGPTYQDGASAVLLKPQVIVPRRRDG